MKRIFLTFVLFAVCSIMLGAQQVRQEKVNVRDQKMTVSDFMAFLEKHSRLTFIHDPEEIDTGTVLHTSTGEQTVQSIIESAFKGTQIIAVWVGDEVVLTPAWRERSYVELGGKRLNGKVLDSEGEPLGGHRL